MSDHDWVPLSGMKAAVPALADWRDAGEGGAVLGREWAAL